MTTFLVLLAAYTLSQFFRAFLAIVAGDLTRDLGLNAADLGAISAIWFATFALAQFPVGWALDRFGPRRTLCTFMLFAIMGAAWFAAADDRLDCLIAMAFIGIGCAPVLMASLYVFGRMQAPGRFAMLSSLMIGLGSLGNLLGASPLVFAVEALGWRGAMTAIAAITASSVLLVFFVLKDPPPVDGETQSGTFLAGLGAIGGIRQIWLLLPLVGISYAAVISMRSLWIAPFLAQVHAFSPAETGHAAFAMAAAMSAGALAYGPIERTLGSPKITTLAGSFLTGFAFIVLSFWGHRSQVAAVALLAVIGAAGMTYGILMAHGRMFFPNHLLGRGVTFLNFVFIGGAGIVQWLSGLFVQTRAASGAPPDRVFSLLCLGFGAALLAATFIYAFAPTGPSSVREARSAPAP